MIQLNGYYLINSINTISNNKVDIKARLNEIFIFDTE